MKNLREIAVEVKNDRERQIAINFYKRASKKGLHKYSKSDGCYVGMNTCHYDKDTIYWDKVTCDRALGPMEKSIPFADIILLANTPSRRAALVAAFMS